LLCCLCEPGILISSEKNLGHCYFYRKNEGPHHFLRKNQVHCYFFKKKSICSQAKIRRLIFFSRNTETMLTEEETMLTEKTMNECKPEQFRHVPIHQVSVQLGNVFAE
jgi:hypothetical protein